MRRRSVVGACGVLVLVGGVEVGTAWGQPTDTPAKPDDTSTDNATGTKGKELGSAKPEVVNEQLKKLAEQWASLSELRKALEKARGKEGQASDSSPSRLIRYGVSAGVAATLYAPGGSGDTLDGAAGGAMPYVGLFPGYWIDSNAAKNTFCALQWSMPEEKAVAAANQKLDDKPGGTSDGGAKDPEQKLDETQKDLERVQESATIARKATQESAEATSEKGKADAVEKADAALKDIQARSKSIDEQLAEARKALIDFEKERKGLKRDYRRADQLRDQRQELREDLVHEIRSLLPHNLDSDAVIGLAARARALAKKSEPGKDGANGRAGEAFDEAHLACVSRVAAEPLLAAGLARGTKPAASGDPNDLQEAQTALKDANDALVVARSAETAAAKTLAAAEEKIATEKSTESEAEALRAKKESKAKAARKDAERAAKDPKVTQPQRVTLEAAAKAAEDEAAKAKLEVESAAKAKDTAQQALKPAKEAVSTAKAETKKKAEAVEHAELGLLKHKLPGQIAAVACSAAEVDEELVSLNKEADDTNANYKGASSNCWGHRFGAYVGYPGMFNATSVVKTRSAIDREDRDINPIMSGGLVFAPNALVAVTTGVWIANAEVAGGENGKDTNTATLWGWVFGLGISSDLLAALGD